MFYINERERGILMNNRRFKCINCYNLFNSDTRTGIAKYCCRSCKEKYRRKLINKKLETIKLFKNQVLVSISDKINNKKYFIVYEKSPNIRESFLVLKEDCLIIITENNNETQTHLQYEKSKAVRVKKCIWV